MELVRGGGKESPEKELWVEGTPEVIEHRLDPDLKLRGLKSSHEGGGWRKNIEVRKRLRISGAVLNDRPS